MQRLISLSLVLLLVSCSTPEEKQLPVKDKPVSPLSEETQIFINSAIKEYHLCLSKVAHKHRQNIKDARDTTQVIVTACEPKLAPIRKRLLGENMPEPIADRYLRRKRVQATRSILRQVMYMQSQTPLQ